MRETIWRKKTRKVHTCCECGKEIPVGSPCREDVELFGCKNGVDRFYTCNACESFRDWVYCESDSEAMKDAEMSQEVPFTH